MRVKNPASRDTRRMITLSCLIIAGVLVFIAVKNGDVTAAAGVILGFLLGSFGIAISVPLYEVPDDEGDGLGE